MMKFTKVDTKKDELLHQKPETYYFLKEFLEAGIEVARVEWVGDYKNVTTCFNALNYAVKKHNLPVKVTVKQKDVYLINTKVNG